MADKEDDTSGIPTPPPPPPPPPKYEPNERTKAQLKHSFTYHPPREDQIPRYNYIRGRAGQLADDFARLCPASRELSLALTKLEEAVMFANAAIARNE